MIFVGPPAASMAVLGDKVAARRLAIQSGRAGGTRYRRRRPGLRTCVCRRSGLSDPDQGGSGWWRARDAGGRIGPRPGRRAGSRRARGAGRLRQRPAVRREVSGPPTSRRGADAGRSSTANWSRLASVIAPFNGVIKRSSRSRPRLASTTRCARRWQQAALNLFRAAAYVNAGTAEFLVDGANFYFLEANTRLQVEHPVTEMRFGCDLVAAQLRIAEGEPIADPQAPGGHAIECRIYAEDAERGFQPVAGRVVYLNLPAGPGVRIDTHLAPGLEVSTWYDGMLGKLDMLGRRPGGGARASGRRTRGVLDSRRAAYRFLPARRDRQRRFSRGSALDPFSCRIF